MENNKEKTTTETKKVGKKVNTNKDAEAKAKVQKLLENTNVSSLVTNNISESNDDKSLDVNLIKKEKSLSWLEDQVENLSKQIEEYENQVIFLKNELAKTKENPNSFVSEANVAIENNLIALFKHFETLHKMYNSDGNFSVKISYPMTGNGILDKFLEYFPHLDKYRTYNHSNRKF